MTYVLSPKGKVVLKSGSPPQLLGSPGPSSSDLAAGERSVELWQGRLLLGDGDLCGGQMPCLPSPAATPHLLLA